MSRDMIKKSPYGNLGDQLWVRETWSAHHVYNHQPPRIINPISYIWYDSDHINDGIIQLGRGKIRSSIFMPRWASRINLLIKDIRVERVQDISRKDVISEGLHKEGIDRWLDWGFHHDDCAGYEFSLLWNRINEKRGFGWDTNCWVWVIEFEVI